MSGGTIAFGSEVKSNIINKRNAYMSKEITIQSSYKVKDTDKFKSSLSAALSTSTVVDEKVTAIVNELAAKNPDGLIEAQYTVSPGNSIEVSSTTLTVDESLEILLSVKITTPVDKSDNKIIKVEEYPVNFEATGLSLVQKALLSGSVPEGESFMEGVTSITVGEVAPTSSDSSTE